MKHQKLSSRRRKNRFRKREDSLNDGPVNNVNVENGVSGRNGSGNDTGGGNDDDDVTEELINRLLGFYPTWPEIEGWLLEVAQSFSSFVKLESIGKTFEGRDLYVLKVDVERPVMWLDGGVHAREWISVSSVLYIVAQVCFKIHAQPSNLAVIQWHIMPAVNADGYAYTFTKTSARLWRKNRGRQDGLRYSAKHNMWCQGADINRNFDFMWSNSTPHSGDLTSIDPCEETFKGPHAASENETMALQSYWLRHADVIGGYVTLHSFGQQIMNRWSYAFINDTDYYKTRPAIKGAAEEIRMFNGEEYAYGAVSEILYSFTGGSGDWIRFNLNLTHVFDIELRDKGRYGFVLPLKFVHPVAEEAWLIFQVLTSNILKNINLESRKYYKTVQKQVARVKCFAADFNETLLQTTDFSSVSIATNFPSIATTLTNAKMLLTMLIILNLFFP
ncbi:hypothetical protein HELRODRAFT_110111 [Helobdella robusta]|uniref:Peptidase M14 domain-containing protein n=1 Tax=Helobdella robusta TaxID=6412 RepID=T1EEZ2_HELRO|nr:hypothetical protein HELRODRAFT_110111 [Helobdella robusta]ESO08544.1 hypothetical protein HELRODRAFT_110111 [Helobdella robusta]